MIFLFFLFEKKIDVVTDTHITGLATVERHVMKMMNQNKKNESQMGVNFENYKLKEKVDFAKKKKKKNCQFLMNFINVWISKKSLLNS